MPASNASLRRYLILLPVLAGIPASSARISALSDWLINNAWLKSSGMGAYYLRPFLAICFGFAIQSAISHSSKQLFSSIIIRLFPLIIIYLMGISLLVYVRYLKKNSSFPRVSEANQQMYSSS